MNKPKQLAAKNNKTVYRLLLTTVIVMAIPLFLEFILFLSYRSSYPIGGMSAWVLLMTISLTAIIAVIAGLCTTGFMLFGGKKYVTDIRVKRLKFWVIGLTLIYIVLFSVLAVAFLSFQHPLNVYTP